VDSSPAALCFAFSLPWDSFEAALSTFRTLNPDPLLPSSQQSLLTPVSVPPPSLMEPVSLFPPPFKLLHLPKTACSDAQKSTLLSNLPFHERRFNPPPVYPHGSICSKSEVSASSFASSLLNLVVPLHRSDFLRIPSKRNGRTLR